jgi:pimeloyl-ACP methyl ester carboxylesterase
VVVEAASGSATAIATGYGFNLAVRIAARRPDLVSDVLAVTPAAAAVLPRAEWRDSDVMAGSDSVAEMLFQMMDTDPRAAVRMVITATNPELDEDKLRERVDLLDDYISNGASRARAQTWLEDDATEQARALGNRLWILHGETEALFEGALAERVRELFPEANIEQFPAGPISRPDLAAAWVRDLMASRAR